MSRALGPPQRGVVIVLVMGFAAGARPVAAGRWRRVFACSALKRRARDLLRENAADRRRGSRLRALGFASLNPTYGPAGRR